MERSKNIFELLRINLYIEISNSLYVRKSILLRTSESVKYLV